MASSPGSDTASTSDLPHRVQIEAGGEGAVVEAIVEALAAVRGVDPIDLDVRLTEHVDTDALERLYRHAGGEPEGDWRVQFDVGGLDVSVRSDGRVTVA